MDINLIIVALLGLFFVGGGLVAVGGLVWLVKRSGPTDGSVPVPVGRDKTVAEGEPVIDCEVSVRHYVQRRRRLDGSERKSHRYVYEADVEVPLPEDLQLYCSLSAHGPADIPGGLEVGISDLDQTYRIHAADPTQVRTVFDDAELVDALGDLAYLGDETRLQPGFLVVTFDEEPSPDTRRELLDALERCVRALHARYRQLSRADAS